MDRTERFYRITRLLQRHTAVPLRDFLEDLEVSKSTFKRDLEYLKDRFGAPIVYERDLGGYRFDPRVEDKDRWQLPGLWFTAAELQALLTMDRLLGELEPGVLSELIAPLRPRLRALLGSGGVHSTAEVARRIRILAIGARKVEPRHFHAATTALLSRRRLHLRHLRRGDGSVVEREVSPQRLAHYRDNWYLDAWCHLRKALRTFAVDAIESARVVDRPAREVAEAELDRHFASGYGIFAGEATQEAVLRFSAGRARWVAHEVWHPKQVGALQPDGTYELRVPYAETPELVMDILRHGAEVTVLAPESLRDAVAGELRAASARY